MTHHQKFKKTKFCPKLRKTAMSSPATSTQRQRARCKELATPLKLKIVCPPTEELRLKKRGREWRGRKISCRVQMLAKEDSSESANSLEHKLTIPKASVSIANGKGTAGHLMLLLKCLKKPSYQSHSSRGKRFEDWHFQHRFPKRQYIGVWGEWVGSIVLKELSPSLQVSRNLKGFNLLIKKTHKVGRG